MLYFRMDVTLKDGVAVTFNEMREYIEYELGATASIDTDLMVRAAEAIETVDVY